MTLSFIVLAIAWALEFALSIHWRRRAERAETIVEELQLHSTQLVPLLRMRAAIRRREVER